MGILHCVGKHFSVFLSKTPSLVSFEMEIKYLGPCWVWLPWWWLGPGLDFFLTIHLFTESVLTNLGQK